VAVFVGIATFVLIIVCVVIGVVVGAFDSRGKINFIHKIHTNIFMYMRDNMIFLTDERFAKIHYKLVQFYEIKALMTLNCVS
jgi:hypothetical protein